MQPLLNWMTKYILDLINYCQWPDSLMRVSLLVEGQEGGLVEVLQEVEVVEEDLLVAEEVPVDVVLEVALLAEGVDVEEQADLVEEGAQELEGADGGEVRHTLKIIAGKLHVFIPFWSSDLHFFL